MVGWGRNVRVGQPNLFAVYCKRRQEHGDFWLLAHLLASPILFSKQLKLQTNQEQNNSLPDSGVRGSLPLASLLAWQVQRGWVVICSVSPSDPSAWGQQCTFGRARTLRCTWNVCLWGVAFWRAWGRLWGLGHSPSRWIVAIYNPKRHHPWWVAVWHCPWGSDPAKSSLVPLQRTTCQNVMVFVPCCIS